MNSDTAKKFVPGEIVLSRLRIQPLIAEIRNTPGSKRLNVDRCRSRAETIAVRPSRPTRYDPTRLFVSQRLSKALNTAKHREINGQDPPDSRVFGTVQCS